MCRTEYENLVSFLKEKKIKILNLQSEQVSARAWVPVTPSLRRVHVV